MAARSRSAGSRRAVGFNLLTLVQRGITAASNAKRERDTRFAREQVQRAIADYCAAQPNANAIEICAGAAERALTDLALQT